jgi:glutamate racemase
LGVTVPEKLVVKGKRQDSSVETVKFTAGGIFALMIFGFVIVFLQPLASVIISETVKLNPRVKVFEVATPLLVPIIEEGENNLAIPILEKYLKPLLAKNIDTLILGCTHYPILKKEIRRIVGENIKVISQDEIIPKKLKEYLSRHKEIKLSKKGNIKILFTDITPTVEDLTFKWFGKNTKLSLVKIDN